MPGLFLGARNIAVSKTDKNCCFHRTFISVCMCAGNTCHIFLSYFVCQMVSGMEKTFNLGDGVRSVCVCVVCSHPCVYVRVCVVCRYLHKHTSGEVHDLRLDSCMCLPLLL